MKLKLRASFEQVSDTLWDFWDRTFWSSFGQVSGKLLFRQKFCLVDPSSSHIFVSNIKPCMFQHKLPQGQSGVVSIKQLSFISW